MGPLRREVRLRWWPIRPARGDSALKLKILSRLVDRLPQGAARRRRDNFLLPPSKDIHDSQHVAVQMQIKPEFIEDLRQAGDVQEA